MARLRVGVDSRWYVASGLIVVHLFCSYFVRDTILISPVEPIAIVLGIIVGNSLRDIFEPCWVARHTINILVKHVRKSRDSTTQCYAAIYTIYYANAAAKPRIMR